MIHKQFPLLPSAHKLRRRMPLLPRVHRPQIRRERDVWIGADSPKSAADKASESDIAAHRFEPQRPSWFRLSCRFQPEADKAIDAPGCMSDYEITAEMLAMLKKADRLPAAAPRPVEAHDTAASAVMLAPSKRRAGGKSTPSQPDTWCERPSSPKKGKRMLESADI
jgi:hypothetical protein